MGLLYQCPYLAAHNYTMYRLSRILRSVIFVQVILVGFSVVDHAQADCLSAIRDERLANFCLLERTSGSLVTVDTAAFIESRLRREGYQLQLSPIKQENPPTVTAKLHYEPLLYYERNINGGNHAKDLVIGDATFVGNDDFLRLSGLVGGIKTGLDGRWLYGKGRYLDYFAHGSGVFSPEHGVGSVTTVWGSMR